MEEAKYWLPFSITTGEIDIPVIHKEMIEPGVKPNLLQRKSPYTVLFHWV